MKMQQLRLGDIATYINGYAFKPEDWCTQGRSIIRIQNLTNSSNEVNYYNKEIHEKYIVKRGDILISWSASIGIYEWDKEESVLNQHIFKVVFDKVNIDKIYFKFIVGVCLEKAMQFMHGSTMKHITKKYFDDILVPIPDLYIQQKIAKILDKAQELIDKRKVQIEALDELVKSRFIEMFGDPIKNPKQLPKIELGKLGDWKTGGTPSRSNNEFYNGTIPWLSSGELNSIYCFGSNEMITETAIKESAAKIIEKGSLLLGMYDTAALKSTINMIECSCNQAIAYAKLDYKLINTIFVYYCIQMGKDFYKSQQRGVRQKNLNLSMVKGLEILMPDLGLQNQFEDFIKQVDKLKFEMEKSLNELENNFNSLMQRAFKGELFS